MFEITVVQRNAKGNIKFNQFGEPLYRSFSSGDSYKIWEFWNRNGTQLSKRKTRSAGKNAEQILRQVNEDYAQRVVKRKRKQFDDGEKI
jgi:hypothetical protein